MASESAAAPGQDTPLLAILPRPLRERHTTKDRIPPSDRLVGNKRHLGYADSITANSG